MGSEGVSELTTTVQSAGLTTVGDRQCLEAYNQVVDELAVIVFRVRYVHYFGALDRLELGTFVEFYVTYEAKLSLT